MAINREDILEALGFETPTSWVGPLFIGFGIGCVVGAGVAMLLAPKSGSELRSDLFERGRDILGRKETRSSMPGGDVLGKNPNPTY
jgi:hypothetical protein